jgi:hypothetical protein
VEHCAAFVPNRRQVLETTASKRYIRALKKLKTILAGLPGDLGEWLS